jgi:uncharacterized protein YjiS (DUF1127 family)
MELLARTYAGTLRLDLIAHLGRRLTNLLSRLLRGCVSSRRDRRARAAGDLHLHLSELSDTELSDYGLRRRQIAEFVASGPIEPS